MMGNDDKATRTSVDGIMSVQEGFTSLGGGGGSALGVGGGWSRRTAAKPEAQ